MAGKSKALSKSEHSRVAEAVAAAEDLTGLQFCVFLGPTEGDARSHAEALFVQAGMHLRPAVLLLVDSGQRRVEVVTASAVRDRVPDTACTDAVAVMTELFAGGDLAAGIVAGVEALAAAAGAGEPGSEDEELPDVLGED